MNDYLNSEKLLELMHDYLNQYGELDSFLKYCENDCDLNGDEVYDAIQEHFYSI
jgi:hypothetical protein